jgi:hypothetical protein
MRAREEGRSGPLQQKRPDFEPARRTIDDRVVRVTAFTDPLREQDKLADLYESLAEARREMGEAQVPFHKFADLVKVQVEKFRQGGSPEVAFRVAVQDGKVSFTARAMKSGEE